MIFINLQFEEIKLKIVCFLILNFYTFDNSERPKKDEIVNRAAQTLSDQSEKMSQNFLQGHVYLKMQQTFAQRKQRGRERAREKVHCLRIIASEVVPSEFVQTSKQHSHGEPL